LKIKSTVSEVNGNGALFNNEFYCAGFDEGSKQI